MSWLPDATPRRLRAVHGWLTVAWVISIPVVVLIKGLAHSVPLLVFISIYANVAGHASAWQAARVEVRQDDDGG